MISEEDKLEIRGIVLREIGELMRDIKGYGGDTGATNDGSAETRIIAPTIMRVVEDRTYRLQSERDDLRRKQS